MYIKRKIYYQGEYYFKYGEYTIMQDKALANGFIEFFWKIKIVNI